MQFLKLSKRFLIDSQIFVALSGTLFATFFMLKQNVFRFDVFALVFITYFNGYLYTKFQNQNKLHKILFINILSFAICGFIFYFLPSIIFYKWLLIAILGLLYNSFFLERYIREIPLLKVFYVGLVWALINAWLCLPDFNSPIFIISFLYISALVLPFDIRDMRADNIVTFPKIIGIQNTKYLAYLLIFIANLCAIFWCEFGYSLAFYLSSIVAFILIYHSENENKDSYFSVFVESCSLLPFLFLMVLRQKL